MADLIDRAPICEKCHVPKGAYNCKLCKVGTAPTIDAELVKHGEWELHHRGCGYYWECSLCHKTAQVYVTPDTKFCPNCGAKMDRGKEI